MSIGNRAICALGLSLFPAVALADLTFCNTAAMRQSVAIGYQDTQDRWVSEGWWNIAPGACQAVLDGDLKRRYYYYRATSPATTFEGRFEFCTQSEPFTIVGDQDCAARGYEAARFLRIDTGADVLSYTFSLEAHAEAPTPPPPVGRLARSDLTPGRFGDPFTLEGLFQGCDIIDGWEHCAFHADGWKLVADVGGATPASVIDEIYSWPINLPVTLRGDFTSMGDITAEVVVARVEERVDGDPFADLRQALQGEWRSVEDPQSVMRIVGSEVFATYGNQPTSDSFLTLLPHCPEAPGLGVGFLRTELETRDAWCLIVGQADGRRLELTNPGRGNILSYRRID